MVGFNICAAHFAGLSLFKRRVRRKDAVVATPEYAGASGSNLTLKTTRLLPDGSNYHDI